MKIRIINGANLNLLGNREKEHYGDFTYEHLLKFYRTIETKYNVEIDALQSNIEGEIVNFIQSSTEYDAIIINPGGYSHTSVVILDALLTINKPVIEVHLSNVLSRENFRHKLITAKAASGLIAGMGKNGYELAVIHILKLHE